LLSNIGDIATILIALMAVSVFVGNELRAWLWEDGIGVSRLFATVIWRSKGSWPVKVEVREDFGDLWRESLFIVDEPAQNASGEVVRPRIKARIVVRKRSPRNVFIQNVRLETGIRSYGVGLWGFTRGAPRKF